MKNISLLAFLTFTFSSGCQVSNKNAIKAAASETQNQQDDEINFYQYI